MTSPDADTPLDRLARTIRRAANGTVVLTGAGISVASGVPSFRGRGGLWERYDPDEYASIQALQRDPERVWGFLRELRSTLEAATPNAAHRAIAELETTGLVSQVITQNVDGLHQRAGSRRVIELHGSDRTLTCLACHACFGRADVTHLLDDPVPSCPACAGVLKPDVIMFGEQLPLPPFRRAEHAIRHCDVLLVIGTSAEVHPASRLPSVARSTGAQIWELNPVQELAHSHGWVGARAEVALPALARKLRPERAWRQVPRLFRRFDPGAWFSDHPDE